MKLIRSSLFKITVRFVGQSNKSGLLKEEFFMASRVSNKRLIDIIMHKYHLDDIDCIDSIAIESYFHL